MSASPPLVALRGIEKRFGHTVANAGVDLELHAGEIHALLGENGAGKSTLVKILFGLLAADAGRIEWQGEPVSIGDPAMARERGIAMVFQHFSLFESLSVLENVALGMGVPADGTLASRVSEVSREYGLALDPSRSVYQLSVGERQRIEIIRCLLLSPRVLIMDEPTSVLVPQEIEELFRVLRRLASEGLAVLYISHKLDEIRQLCDTATILRGGQVVATADPAEENADSLAAMMVGAELTDAVARVADPASDTSAPRLRLDALDLPAEERQGTELRSISLELRAGEIVGIAGVAGNGQDELLAALSGESLVADATMLSLGGRPIGRTSPGERRRLGLCTLPEARLGHATVPSATLTENALLTARHRRPLARLGWIDRAAARRFAQDVIERFDVRCSGPDAPAASLSGGNLQKFIVGREILQSPDVLVVAQPTWGVDAGAALTIRRALHELAEAGTAVLVISQDLDELLDMATRLAALCAGRLSAVHRRDEIDASRLGLLMGGETLADAA